MSGEHNSGGRIAPLAVAALGVVFGDIGTSPLYAMSACFTGPNIQVTPEHIFGILSFIFWALVLVILVKYVAVVLNCDNKGEGGVLALTALVVNTERASPRKRIYGILGILGAALFFSDGAITPAISVLSAVEGLHVAVPDAQIPILPITLVVLVGLFLIQRHGTGSVGKVFGPVMLGWFAILSVMGVSWIVREPRVLVALSPVYAVQLISQHQISALAVLAGVFLTVTGGEALYADMGHFGKTPIRLSWVLIVMPALVLNYFGQGALLIQNPTAISNPFFLMAPQWSLLPLVVISTAATVIASGDLRRVLRDDAGREPGAVPARARRTLLRRIRRSDLRAHHELDHDAGDPRAGGGVRQFGGARGGLWIGGVGRDDHRDAPHTQPDQIPDGEEEPVAARGAVALVHHRPGIPARQHDQASGRRLAAPDVGLHHLLADADLGKRAGIGHGASAP